MTLPELLGILGILVGVIVGSVLGFALSLSWWTAGTALLGGAIGWFGGVLLAPVLDERLAKSEKTETGIETEP